MSNTRREFISTRLIFLAIVFVYLIVYFPIFAASEDFWDGSIISFAWASRNKITFSTWFDESGWPLVRWLYEIIYEFCLSLSLNFKYVVNFITGILVATSAYEIYRLSRAVYKFDEKSSLYGVLFFLLMPFSNLYFSTAFIQLMLFVYLCLLGSRLYLENKMVPWAFLLLAISFQHNSNPCLLFVFIALAYAFGGRTQIKKDIIFLGLLAVWYFAFKLMFKPYGLYAGYNTINLMNAFNIKLYAMYLKFFATAYPALCLAAGLLILKQFNAIKYCLLFLCATMLTMIPYILVGKYFQIFRWEDVAAWDYRFTLNSVPIVTLGFIFILHFIRSSNLSVWYQRMLYLVLCSAVIMNTIYLVNGYKIRADDLIYQTSMVNFFKAKKDQFKTGFVQIENTDNFYYELTNYETNYYLYLAFNEKRLELYNPSMIGYKMAPVYQDKYILLSAKPQCIYRVKLSGNFDNFSVFERIVYLYSRESLPLDKFNFQAGIVNQSCDNLGL
jgi:hypothetical protein